MPTLTLPATGKATSGTVRKWLKQPNESVRVGDILLHVENDEGLFEVESALAGQLEQILAPVGKTLPAQGALAIVSGGDEPATARNAPSAQSHAGKMTTTSQSTGKVTPVLMPQAGQSMEEGTLVKWRIAVGDRVAKGDIIFEIETDKATMEVEAIDSGRLARIVLPEGGTLKVLEPVAYLADNEKDVDAFLQGSLAPAVAVAGQSASPAESTSSPSAIPQQTKPPAQSAHPAADGGRVKASPAARRVATERGIDLASIGAGSGPQGRILSNDVPASAPKAAAATPAAQGVAPVTAEGIKRKRMSAMRKAIGKALSHSKQTIPHFYLKLTVNAEALFNFYQAEKAKYPCSLNDVVVLACSRAVSEFPAFRSRVEGDEIVELPTSNIGIAVGMEEGLVVPVLIGAEQMSLQQIGAGTRRIAAAARSGKIEGMGQGVFTITNLGMFGVEEFSAIINPPEAAILAVGAIREEVIVSGGTLKAGRVMTAVLSADHRLIDGALAAKFMARLKELLEYPGQAASS
ncbi:MAG: Pyruvate dehydrogenase complex, component [Verrucomicrobiota bacterium]|jgi:pyruvate dehydrogenase E2 component (dihydrolipoamide acetyltransferase)